MKKIKYVLLLLALSGRAYANTCTLAAGTYANLAATAGHWTGTNCTGGAYVPTTPDIVIIPASGASLTLASGDSWHVGTSTIGLGVAFTMTAGASAVSYSTFTLASGATLQIDGFDYATNYLGQINQFAHFNANGTILGHTAAGVDNVLSCDGMCSIIGSTMTIPAADANWNNSGTYTWTGVSNGAGNVPSSFYRQGNIYALPVWGNGGDHLRISNAGGNGPDTFASSSLSFSGISCSPACTGGNSILVTRVSTLAQVVSAGQYYFDGTTGFVYWWNNSGSGSSTSVTFTFKYLTFSSWVVRSITSQTYDNLDIENSSFQMMGSTSSAGIWAVTCQNRYSTGAGGTNQNCIVKNNTFTNSNRPIGLISVNGSAGDLVPIEGNTIDLCPSGSIYYYSSCVYTILCSYISISSNTVNSADYYFIIDGGAGAAPGYSIRNNVVVGNSTLTCGYNTDAGMVIDGNLFVGYSGAGGDTRNVVGCRGTAGNNVQITNNVWHGGFRWINYDNYDTISNNFIAQYGHHVLMGPGLSNVYTSSATITNNIFSNIAVGAGNGLDLTYTSYMWVDSATVAHNTLYAANGYSAADLSGDRYDNDASDIMSNIKFHSNIISTSTIGVLRSPDNSTFNSRLHYLVNGWNDVYLNGTNYSSFNQFSTVTGTANVTGVSLFNPSATLPISGKTLTFTVTSNINQTLTWDGGSPVQIGITSGTATSGGANTITDTGKNFSTDLSNANTPEGAWIKILSGTSAGDIRMVTTVAATQLTVSSAWTTPPDNTSTYAIYRAEVVLTASGATTVNAGLYWPSVPTTTKSDTSVGISANSFNLDPQFVAPTRSITTWDASLGGPGTETSAIARVAANKNLTTTSLLPYLRAGFNPQNQSLATAAYDGTTVGAVQFSLTNPPVKQIFGSGTIKGNGTIF